MDFPSLAALQEQLPIFPCDLTDLPVSLQQYAEHYGLRQLAQRCCATVELGGCDIAGMQINLCHFVPSVTPLGTLLVVTGYTDHIGLFGKVYELALQHSLQVYVFDLPGHGLSSGERAGIDDFATYQSVLRVVVNEYCLPAAGPLFAVGQSTGGGILLDALLHDDELAAAFSCVSALAPLLYPRRFFQIRCLYMLLSPFLKKVQRAFRSVSHDEGFNCFLQQHDALQPESLSVSWIGALIRWTAMMEQSAPSGFPLQLLQGTDDTTVDAGTNMKAYRQLFPESQLHWIEGARHHMVNEADVWWQPISKHIGRYWQEGLQKYYEGVDSLAEVPIMRPH
ncbi:alpha/beta hydrolase [Pokkaliibacter sp. MBI-7]|uniref:alpha/beta hydrolase n=1 Tax=Pokkaliibacter sp. MBI-7 TaxID=3040600 RepID=UPI00244A6060|nr:alpha/beta hydrolase [Pokkaliibacter sp. MBI-7]MDH2432670.1 alpha/beta hydrolase [Pokkaliibacter sp. MBI-7]